MLSGEGNENSQKTSKFNEQERTLHVQHTFFSTAAIKVSCYSSNETGLLCFLALAPALSRLSTSM